MADPTRHARVKALFMDACDLDRPARARFLDEACGDDAGVRAEVEALLGFEERRPAFLERPAVAPPPVDGRGAEGSGAEPSLDGAARRGGGARAGDASGEGPHAGSPVDDALDGETSDALLPASIGDFRVLRRLGTGGMGTVYEVEQQRPRRIVALKLLHPGLASTVALRRFEREGEILGRLQHPGIARIYEAGHVDTDLGPQPYLAMEYVRGEPITRHARTLLATTGERLRLFARLCDAVQHAHEQGVVHRDLKPANILVDETGRPKVLDFGIARATDGDLTLASLKTSTGAILGTLAYMSPEQASGDPTAIDARSDVYALGVLLYELLTGELPYDVSSGSLPAAIERIRYAEPRRLTTLHRGLGGDVETIVATALEKDPGRRYASAAALAADVRHVLADEPIEAHPPSRVYRASKFVRRHRTLAIAAAAVLVSLVTGLAVAVRFGLSEADARLVAERSTAEARAQAYASGLLAAQLMAERGGVASVTKQLLSLPEEQRGWEWSLMLRRSDRTLARRKVPGVAHAAYRDDEHVLHVSAQGAVGVWDAVTGDDLALGVPQPGARPVALSDDGRWLLGHRDGALLLSDLAAGNGTRVIPWAGCGPRSGPWCAAIGPGARQLAFATDDGVVELVDVGPPTRVTPLVDNDRNANLPRFSADGAYLAVSGSARVRCFDLATNTQLWTHGKQGHHFDSVAFDLLRGRVAFGLALGIAIHDLSSGKLLEEWTGQQLNTVRLGAPFRLEFDPSGRHLATGFRGGELRVLDAETGLLEATARPEPGWKATDVAWSPDGSTLLSCNREAGTLRLWNGELSTSQVLAREDTWLNGMALSRDGASVAAGGGDGVLRVWDAGTGRERWRAGPGGGVSSVTWSPDGARVAAALHGAGFAVWDATTGASLLHDRTRTTTCARYTPDGTRLLVGARRGQVLAFDASTPASPSTLRSTSISASTLAPTSTSTLPEVFAVSVGEADVQSLACSPDGRLVAVGDADGGIALIDAASGAPVASVAGPRGGPAGYQGTLALAFSPDGRLLATGSGGGSLAVRELPSLAVLRDFIGYRGEVFDVAFLPDGSRLLSGGRDGRLRVWDPATGGELASFGEVDSYHWSLAVTPDGRAVLTSSGDGTLRLWDSAPAAVGWAERRLARRAR